MAVEVGNVVTMRTWSGEWTEIKVQKLGMSKEYGPTVEGVEVDSWRHTTLPLSHLVEMARAKSMGHGKWDVALPDGAIERVRSKRAAQELCRDRGYVMVVD